MLTSTYIHIRGVRPIHERDLWDQGALTWDDFLKEPGRWVVGGLRIPTLRRAIENSQIHLDAANHQYFARRLPQKEHWRAFADFRDTVAYLDIETSGTYRDDSVTVIGVYDGVAYTPFIKGENLADFPDAISHFSTIITYFGGGFDLPIILREFPNLEFDQFHIDLCPTLRRLGYKGGLKSIERQFGIERSPETAGLTGRDAVYLWRRLLRGDEKAREILIQYNKEDVINLEPLAEEAYMGLRRFALETSAPAP